MVSTVAPAVAGRRDVVEHHHRREARRAGERALAWSASGRSHAAQTLAAGAARRTRRRRVRVFAHATSRRKRSPRRKSPPRRRYSRNAVEVAPRSSRTAEPSPAEQQRHSHLLRRGDATGMRARCRRASPRASRSRLEDAPHASWHSSRCRTSRERLDALLHKAKLDGVETAFSFTEIDHRARLRYDMALTDETDARGASCASRRCARSASSSRRRAGGSAARL